MSLLTVSLFAMLLTFPYAMQLVFNTRRQLRSLAPSFMHLEGDVAFFTLTRLLRDDETGISQRAFSLCDDKILDLCVIKYLVVFLYQEVTQGLNSSSPDKNSGNTLSYAS
jgi:hypothetical protein